VSKFGILTTWFGPGLNAFVFLDFGDFEDFDDFELFFDLVLLDDLVTVLDLEFFLDLVAVDLPFDFVLVLVLFFDFDARDDLCTRLRDRPTIISISPSVSESRSTISGKGGHRNGSGLDFLRFLARFRVCRFLVSDGLESDVVDDFRSRPLVVLDRDLFAFDVLLFSLRFLRGGASGSQSESESSAVVGGSQSDDSEDMVSPSNTCK